MSGENTQVLLAPEAEAYVENLERFELKNIGNSSWTKQHEYIEKLNMQAVINATQQEDEYVKEFLITYEKIPVLIHDMIVTEVWKQKIFPELLKMNFKPKSTFPIYMVLFHEATVVNLLETIMYYKESCEAAEDSILDFVDYCYRKLTELAASNEEDDEEIDISNTGSSVTSTSLEELEKQEKSLNFNICIKALSLLRYMTDHLESLQLSVITRILNTHDIPMLLVHFVENQPWTRRNDEKIYKYIDNNWQEVSPEDSLKITKTEGQVWIALFQLLMNSSCQQKYELNPYRKNILLKLRTYLNDIIIDQLPMLGEMQRYLEHLSMMDPPAAKKDLVLEQIPEIRDNILKENGGKWSKLAKLQSRTVFNASESDMREQAKRWASTYNFDVLEGLLTDPPKCAMCGQPATKRCSRCQNEWYCRRECQVTHWSKHKKACDLLHESIQKLSEESSSNKQR